MNEERNSRYLNLINELLSCPFSEVSAILNANQDLIDAGLVQVIEQVAAMKEEKDARYSAKFLIDVARQLAEELGLSLSTPTSAPDPNPDPQHTFLIQVLQAIAMSNGDPSVVYPVLKATPDKLDDNFAQVLRNWVGDTLPNMESLADIENFAKLISYFSNLIQQFPLGNRARNLEIAIAGYEIVTPVVTREASPELWATLQICLGVAYLYRIRGERADNLEQAITCLNQALLVHTRETSPELWADTHNNLGVAYLYRIRGERADNLEQAITFLNQALQVRTRDAFPEKWAMTQNNLGFAYLYRIRGERADNLEQAITRLNQALQVRTRDVSPKDWADTQINLGIAYLYRIRGERADNLEQAINCYYQALLEYTREDFPEKWADIQNNLAFTYNKRILWKREDNLEQAIKCYHQALLVFTCEDFPEKWADIQNNLGAAYNERILEERTDNLEQAINCYQQAMLVLTREDFPEKWAINQYSLGLVYINLSDVRGDRGEANLRTSAIRCFTEALQIFNCDAFPQNYAETLFKLGIVYQKDNQLQLAHDTFELAIDTVKSLRDKTFSGDEAKQKLAEYYNELYRRMVEVCLALNNPSEAIEYVEGSKARNLVELLCERDHYPKGATQEICNRLNQLRRDIRAEQQRLDIGKRIENTNPSSPVIAQGFIEVFPQELRPHLSRSFAPFTIDRTRLNELQQQLDRLIEDTIQPIDPRFSLTQKVGSISFKEIQKLISDNQTVIIEWYITRAGFETFIITRHSLQRLILPTPADDLKALIGWVNEYIAAYAQEKNLWIDSLASRLNRLAEILHLEDILKLVPNTCLRLISSPIATCTYFPFMPCPSLRVICFWIALPKV
jgi:tetratricopeptide (TPR) repeat protein